ncbi:MAG: hypothetical protein IJP27_10195 [Clostridia bacterium]|nr:hypothetical protein [Clostridia bacterium]
MNKVLIELHIPAIYEHFDIFAPVDVPIRTLSEIIAAGIAEITNGKYICSETEQLCMKEPCGLLDPSLTLQDYGLKDGVQLYLI